MLYPIKFKPLIVERIWGGQKLNTFFSKSLEGISNAGESWEISAVENAETIVENGFLQGNTLSEIIEIYMADLVGEKVYEKFGIEFPLLIKYIDANDVLSIQVHPDDKTAEKRHHAFGKTEMWYVIDADPDSYVISGFNKDVSKEEYLQYLNSGKLEQILKKVPAKAGDVFFIPAGRVHAIGKGLLLAEIQQTSDITYRIFDWNRVDKNGNPRELHTEEALDVIDYKEIKEPKTLYTPDKNKEVNLIECNYFTTNILEIDKEMEREYEWIDSFKILMCIDGCATITYEGENYIINKGETYLIPAVIDSITIKPNSQSKIIEVYIK